MVGFGVAHIHELSTLARLVIPHVVRVKHCALFFGMQSVPLAWGWQQLPLSCSSSHYKVFSACTFGVDAGSVVCKAHSQPVRPLLTS